MNIKERSLMTSRKPLFPFFPILPMFGIGLLIGNFYLNLKIYQKLKTIPLSTQSIGTNAGGDQDSSIERNQYIHTENLSPDDFNRNK